MDQLIASYSQSKTLHHAYFVVGDGSVLSQLKIFLENEMGFKTSGNPDFWHGKFGTLTIDGARTLSDNQERKSFGTDIQTTTSEKSPQQKKIFIIETDFITEEAQNALLKVFEEPTVDTHFFILSPQDTLLPTLRSRMQIIFHSDASRTFSEPVLNMKLAERIGMVKKITEGITDEEKTKQDAIILLNQIERELYEKGIEKHAHSLKITESARETLYDRGAPVKMILEHVMLSI